MLCLGILLVSPTIILLASVGAAMTISLPRNGVLIGILVLPFYVPPLIFVTGLFEAALLKQNVFPYVYWLVALLFLALGWLLCDVDLFADCGRGLELCYSRKWRLKVIGC